MTMDLALNVSLDPTLGCGQAHRWKKTDGTWEGVISNEVIRLRQTDEGISVDGSDDRASILHYLGADDDLDAIIAEISERDPYVASLASRCPGLRILRQEPWECTATYLLATNANVKRIASMVESVCNTFGKDLGCRHAFPTPGEILDRSEEIHSCKLGFREPRLIELAEKVENGEHDPYALCELDYNGCVEELKKINGIGPKVADCVALFAYSHLNAFPIDARISKVMEERYGITGSYRKVSEYGMDLFGRYAGYAQEFLYHSDFI